MFNAPHLLETALLMLVAFLLGAVIGLALRYLIARPKPVAVQSAPVAKPAEAPPATPDLVKAPEIAPLPRPSVSERIAAAAAGKSAADTGMQAAVRMPELSLPTMPAIAPSRTAGETVAGRHIDNPEHPQPASLEDVRAELEAQIEGSPVPPEAIASAKAEIVAAMAEPKAVEAPPPAAEAFAATAANEDATIIPAALDKPDAPLPDANDALEAEAVTPMLAQVSDEEAEEKLPVEERVEPALSAKTVVLVDPPKELAAEIQDVIETPDEDPVPDVVAEAPLVEPVFEKEADEAAADTLFPAREAPEPEPARDADQREDELAAMRAIEGGWTPRKPAAPRPPADLPEGVTAADIAAADHAVVQSGAAVANATAAVTAVLEEATPADPAAPAQPPATAEITPLKPARPAGGFGRPSGLDAPRDGIKDDLGQIKGLGPAIESSLNGLGIYHYDQIADWDQKAVVWIENHFGFKGRITRERWQEQARDLVRGRMPVARPVRR